MASPILDSMRREGPAIFYDDGFRNMIEMHIPWLLSRPNTRMISVEPANAMRNEFDFFSFLNELNIDVHLHWIYMRLNGYVTPEEFRSDVTAIFVPDLTDIENLRATYTTVHRIR